MSTLRQKMLDSTDFLVGVELVTTRGTMDEVKSVQTRRLATELTERDTVDWVSITDNAEGNPMLSPIALGKNILYGGKEVLIHLSCKDFNRNGLESEAWQLASEGFQNILALSGDYPSSGYHGRAKPVFDIDSIGLLTLLGEMNRGLDRPAASAGNSTRLKKTNFFTGAVVFNFKLLENEVVPQYLKMEKNSVGCLIHCRANRFRRAQEPRNVGLPGSARTCEHASHRKRVPAFVAGCQVLSRTENPRSRDQ